MQMQETLRGHTIHFKNAPRIIATGSIAGPKECAGIAGAFVDRALDDDMFCESTFEKAECKMLSYAIDSAICNAGLDRERIDVLFSGDLLNQIISASFAARWDTSPSRGSPHAHMGSAARTSTVARIIAAIRFPL